MNNKTKNLYAGSYEKVKSNTALLGFTSFFFTVSTVAQAVERTTSDQKVMVLILSQAACSLLVVLVSV